MKDLPLLVRYENKSSQTLRNTKSRCIGHVNKMMESRLDLAKKKSFIRTWIRGNTQSRAKRNKDLSGMFDW